MSRKPDPRPERTKALLFNALIELIQEKRWDKIRVQDILDRTGVGRSTFYAHFDNKFDLLTAGIPTQTMTVTNADGEADLLPLLAHVAESRPIMWPLMNQPLLGDILDTFQRGLSAAWTNHFTTLGIPAERHDVPAELLAGGFLSVMRDWLKDGCKRSPEEMNDEFCAYAQQIIDLTAGGPIAARPAMA